MNNSWNPKLLNQSVEKGLDRLDAGLKAKFLYVCDLLEIFGPHQVGSPHAKHLRGDLWEIRLIGAGASARAIYVTVTGQTIVVVHVFLKKPENTKTCAYRCAPETEGNFGMKDIKDLKQQWLKDSKVNKAYAQMQPAIELACTLIAARSRAQLTQAEVAARMGTTQSVVARLESGRTLPSVKSLYCYAKAVDAKPSFQLLQA